MDDHDLVAQVLRGDSQAWTRLVRKHGAVVRATIEELRSSLPGPVAAQLDPERLTLQVFASLLEDDRRRLRKVGPEADISAWLRLIARRLALKTSLQSQRQRSMSESLEDELRDGGPLREALRGDIKELPPRDQLALCLFLFEGVHPARISQHLGIELPQLERFLQSAVERLQQRLASMRGR